MATYVQGCRFPLWHFRKGARRHRRTRARFGWTWLRRAYACGQGSRASQISKISDFVMVRSPNRRERHSIGTRAPQEVCEREDTRQPTRCVHEVHAIRRWRKLWRNGPCDGMGGKLRIWGSEVRILPGSPALSSYLPCKKYSIF